MPNIDTKERRDSSKKGTDELVSTSSTRLAHFRGEIKLKVVEFSGMLTKNRAIDM